MSYISGIQYPSGRRIYCDEHPERGEFISSPSLAHPHHTPESAAASVDALVRFFEIRDRSAITTFVEPCPHFP